MPSSSRPCAGGAGERLPQSAARGAARGRAPAPAGPPDDLTEREVEILRLIALGHTNAEIGEQLYLSVRTVESHRAHVQQKLRLSTRAELVRYAIDRGLLQDAERPRRPSRAGFPHGRTDGPRMAPGKRRDHDTMSHRGRLASPLPGS